MKTNQVSSVEQVRQCDSGGREQAAGLPVLNSTYSATARPPAAAGGRGRFRMGVRRALLQNGQGRRKEASGPPELAFMGPFVNVRVLF